MIATCKACGKDFLTEADPYVVRPTTKEYELYCSCMILGHSQTTDFITHDRIAELEKAEMDLTELRKFHKRTIEVLRANYDELKTEHDKLLLQLLGEDVL